MRGRGHPQGCGLLGGGTRPHSLGVLREQWDLCVELGRVLGGFWLRGGPPSPPHVPEVAQKLGRSFLRFL